MSASNPNIPDRAANDIWRQHEAQIRDLYLNQKKTLKEVKAEMEKNGFPRKPRSTWETKLRVDLGIRKKVKAEDWPLVYRHLAPRLEKPGKKRLRRPTTIRLDNNEIPFDEAWKEIRRSGAHKLSPRMLPQGSLRHGIEVRSPSPVLSHRSITKDLASSVGSIVPGASGCTAALQLYAPQTVIRGGPPCATSSVSLFSTNLPPTPWVSLCVNLQRLFHNSMPVRLLEAWKSLEWWNIVPLGWKLRAHDIEDFQSRLELLPASSPRLPRPSHDLGYRLVAARGNMPLSDFISTAIYLLSNRLHDDQDSDKGLQILFSLFEHDVNLFTQILECEPSTGRAIWESLMSYSDNRHRMRSHRKRHMSHDGSNEHFEKEYDNRISRFLLDIGIRYSWVDASDFDVLGSALRMDCSTDVLEKILDQFCRSGHGHSPRKVAEMISTSYQKGHLNIVNGLIRRFPINDESFDHSWTGEFPPTSVFLAFIRWVFYGNDDNDWRVLDFFLSNGADVDMNLHGQTYYVSASRIRWYDKNEINRALRPTIVDHSLRLDRRLFMRLAQHSKVPKSALTKRGLLISLENGPAALRDYLETRVPAIDPFNLRIVGSLLRFIVDDQLDPDEWGLSYDINLKIVRNLLLYADNMHWPSIFHQRINQLFQEVWVTPFRRPEQFASATDEDWQLLGLLVQKGAEIEDDHLKYGVEKEGARFLKWVQPLVKDFSTKAAGSLGEAVKCNNFEAVQFLVQSRVDPNASVDLAEAVRQDNFDMVKFLVQNGVNPDAPGALGEAARRNNFEVVEFLLKRGANPNAFVNAKVGKLTVSDDRAFNKMTQRSLDQTYSIQAVASGIGAISEERSSLDMCRFLADRGAKFVLGPNDLTPFAFLAFLLEDVYDDPELFDKVEFILNTLKQTTHWARPPSFLLELCVVRFKSAVHSSKANERIRIFEYLLDEGADVSPGSPLTALARFGAPRALMERVLDAGADLDAYNGVRSFLVHDQTPLQAAASQGNQDFVDLFLEKGANVNRPARGEWGRTALQAICGWNPATEKEHCRKMTICASLLNSGAEINAAPSSRDGITALQAAVLNGDLELVAILLHAGADVNGPPYKYDNGNRGYRGCYFKFSVLDLAAEFGRLDVAKLLLNANAVSSVGGITGYDGAINIAKRSRNKAVASLICEHLGDVLQPGLDLLDFWTAADDYDAHGHETDCESGDEKCLLRRFNRNAENDQSSTGEESSQDDLESVSSSGWDSLTDQEPGYAPAYEFPEDVADIRWDHHIVPDSFTGALTEMSDSRALGDLQVLPNTSMDDWIAHSGTGFVFPQEDMEIPGTDWMLHNTFDAWAGIPDYNTSWQHVFEIQDLDFGFASFDPSHQLPPSDWPREPDIEEGQDLAEQDFTE